MNRKYLAGTILIVLSMSIVAVAQDHHKGIDHRDGVNKRGDQGMGFDHLKTTHNFRLFADGGAIDVSANDGNDTVSRDQIRGHLKRIAAMFSEGNFSIPMFVHDQVPPGVEEMKRQKAAISYRYEQTQSGARVRISASNAEALMAIHEFLRFQIQEHHTGDTQEITKNQ